MISKTLFLTLFLLPLALTIWFVNQFGVNVAFWDEWELMYLLDSINSGNVSFQIFLAQHNEHRILFPRLIFIVVGYLSNWNFKSLMFSSILLSVISFLIIFKLSRLTTFNIYSETETEKGFLSDRNLLTLVVDLLSCFMLFSLVQWENWLWGFQIAWFLIINCLLLAIYLIYALDIIVSLKVFLSALLCFISSFSLAYGIFTWIALLPVLLALDTSGKTKLRVTSIWLCMFLLTLYLYLHDYVKPPHHPSINFPISHLSTFFHFLLVLFGSPFKGHETEFGFSILALSALVNTFYIYILVRSIRDSNILIICKKLNPWLSISWFSLMFGFATAIGRSGIGINQATASRYTTIIIFLYISILYMSLILLINFGNNFKSQYAYFCMGILFSVLMTNLVNSSSQAIIYAEINSISKNEAKSCLRLINYLNQNSNLTCLNSIYPTLNFFLPQKKLISNIGFSDFIEDAQFVTDDPDLFIGFIDSAEKQITTSQKSKVINVTGWAKISSSKTKYPNIVLFSLNDQRTFFATTHTYLERKDVANYLRSSEYTFSGWSIDLDLAFLQQTTSNVIKAWIYDSEINKFLPLNGQVLISPSSALCLNHGSSIQ